MKNISENTTEQLQISAGLPANQEEQGAVGRCQLAQQHRNEPKPAGTKHNSFKKFELLKLSIETFKMSFNAYNEYTIGFCKTENGFSDSQRADFFDELILSYYEIIINSYKKLSNNKRDYINDLIETYIEIWARAPKLKEKNYFTPFLFDLCKFLFRMKEFEKLTFFYNLMIFSKEIPFLEYNGDLENYLSDLHIRENKEDIFKDIKEINRNTKSDGFDAALFDYEYNRFFQILKLWKERSCGYHSKDEIFFMTGLFILDELIERFYIKNDDDKVHEINFHYENTLKYFKKAMACNPSNPRYFYEYARCLKNSGKSDEAEIFFRKAFDLNKNDGCF